MLRLAVRFWLANHESDSQVQHGDVLVCGLGDVPLLRLPRVCRLLRACVRRVLALWERDHVLPHTVRFHDAEYLHEARLQQRLHEVQRCCCRDARVSCMRPWRAEWHVHLQSRLVPLLDSGRCATTQMVTAAATSSTPCASRKGRCTFGGALPVRRSAERDVGGRSELLLSNVPCQELHGADVPRAELARPNRRVRLHEPGSPMRASYTVRWHGMPEKPVEPDDVSVRAVHPQHVPERCHDESIR